MHIHSQLVSTCLHRLEHTSAHFHPSAIQGAWHIQTLATLITNGAFEKLLKKNKRKKISFWQVAEKAWQYFFSNQLNEQWRNKNPYYSELIYSDDILVYPYTETHSVCPWGFLWVSQIIPNVLSWSLPWPLMYLSSSRVSTRWLSQKALLKKNPRKLQKDTNTRFIHNERLHA